MPPHKTTYSHHLNRKRGMAGTWRDPEAYDPDSPPTDEDGKPLKCRIIGDNGRLCQIEFEDKTTRVVERSLVRRAVK